MSRIYSKITCKGPENSGPLLREKTMGINLEITQMLELSDIDFKAALRTILHEVKVYTFEISGKVEAFHDK